MSINHTCQTAFFIPSHSFPLRFKLCFPDVHKDVFVSLSLDIIVNRIVCNYFQYAYKLYRIFIKMNLYF